MSDAAGGRTRVTGLVASASVAAVLLFFTGPRNTSLLAALGCGAESLVAFSLFDLLEHFGLFIRWIDGSSPFLLATQAPLTTARRAEQIFGFCDLSAHPVRQTCLAADRCLSVCKRAGLHSTDRHPTAATIPGLVTFRQCPHFLFNALLAGSGVLEAADAAGADLKWFVIDTIPARWR